MKKTRAWLCNVGAWHVGASHIHLPLPYFQI